jgi:hypothetical protein
MELYVELMQATGKAFLTERSDQGHGTPLVSTADLLAMQIYKHPAAVLTLDMLHLQTSDIEESNVRSGCAQNDPGGNSTEGWCGPGG